MSVLPRAPVTAGLLTNRGWEGLELTIRHFKIFGVAEGIVSCWVHGLAEFGCQRTRAEYRGFSRSPGLQPGVSPARSLRQMAIHRLQMGQAKRFFQNL